MSYKVFPGRVRLARVDQFRPWWVRCNSCSHLALMSPDWESRVGTSRCGDCGTVSKTKFPQIEGVVIIEKLPLWLKGRFRSHVLWALNGDHLEYLEHVLTSKLRERPVIGGRRSSYTTVMPYNLPSWLLSAKNREDLLRLIKKLKATIPAQVPKSQ